MNLVKPPPKLSTVENGKMRPPTTLRDRMRPITTVEPWSFQSPTPIMHLLFDSIKSIYLHHLLHRVIFAVIRLGQQWEA